MVTKFRGQEVEPTENINLTVQFKDGNGNFIDTDSFPKISIVQPNGLVLLSPTSVGVTRTDIGKYSYLFSVPYGGPLGVFNDIWLAYIGGYRVESTFSFVVSKTQIPSINLDGYLHLGDDPGFNYSQCAIANINALLKALKARLNSSGKSVSKDSFGNKIYVNCDIFSIETLTTFLATALTDFNQIPYFTFFQFDDSNFVQQFFEVLVEGATIYALASKAILERGAEYNISDNGITFTPPTVSEVLMTQYSSLLTLHFDKLKYIKNSLRPQPMGLGTLSMSSGINPSYAKLRHLRQRRLI